MKFPCCIVAYSCSVFQKKYADIKEKFRIYRHKREIIFSIQDLIYQLKRNMFDFCWRCPISYMKVDYPVLCSSVVNQKARSNCMLEDYEIGNFLSVCVCVFRVSRKDGIIKKKLTIKLKFQ